MKIIFVISSTNLRYGRGTGRVLHHAKPALDREFEEVLYVSGHNVYEFIVGIFRILKRNPLSFNFIIYNSQSSIVKRFNPFWKSYYYFSSLFGIRPAVYWHEMPYFVQKTTGKSRSALRIFKNRNILQLCCSEANKPSAYVF